MVKPGIFFGLLPLFDIAGDYLRWLRVGAMLTGRLHSLFKLPGAGSRSGLTHPWVP